jgi:hypothetical protein
MAESSTKRRLNRLRKAAEAYLDAQDDDGKDAYRREVQYRRCLNALPAEDVVDMVNAWVTVDGSKKPAAPIRDKLALLKKGTHRK